MQLVQLKPTTDTEIQKTDARSRRYRRRQTVSDPEFGTVSFQVSTRIVRGWQRWGFFRGRPGHVLAVRPDPKPAVSSPGRARRRRCASRHGFRLAAFRFRPGRCARPPAIPLFSSPPPRPPARKRPFVNAATDRSPPRRRLAHSPTGEGVSASLIVHFQWKGNGVALLVRKCAVLGRDGIFSGGAGESRQATGEEEVSSGGGIRPVTPLAWNATGLRGWMMLLVQGTAAYSAALSWIILTRSIKCWIIHPISGLKLCPSSNRIFNE